MNINQLIGETLTEINGDLERALDGLTTGEVEWRPDEESNSIGFSLWHMIRAEDYWISDFAMKVPHVFAQKGWTQKWEIPAADTGARYEKEDLASFVTPPVEEICAYGREVRAQTLDYLSSLKEADFAAMPQTDNLRQRGYTIGRMFGHILCELSQHLGHVRYLRGLQRGLNK